MARGGDREAAFELLARYRARIYNFCRGYLARDDDAEDAAQEVVAKVAGAPWPEGSFRAWLYRVARNHCLTVIQHQRGARLPFTGAFTSQLRSQRTGPGTAAERRERDERLFEAMDSLSQPHAEVLFLRYFEDLSRQEMAEVLGLEESVVKSRLSKARRELARRMERYSRGEQEGR